MRSTTPAWPLKTANESCWLGQKAAALQQGSLAGCARYTIPYLVDVHGAALVQVGNVMEEILGGLLRGEVWR